MKRFWPVCTVLSLLACSGSDSLAPEAPAGRAPEVTITSPADGSVFPLGGLVALTATARDSEGVDLGDDIVWSSDVSGALGKGRSLETSALAVGSQLLTAAVTDTRGKSGTSSVRVVVRDDAPPRVTVVEPGRESSVTEGDAVTFTATATDDEDGDLSASVAWSSDLDGPLATGASFKTSSLSVGAHTVTSSVTDAMGQTGTDQVQVLVRVDAAPSLAITTPGQDTTVIEGDPVSFTAQATDPEDGDLGGSLSWASDLDGLLGTGGALTTAGLSTGTHVVTASVSDAAGHIVTDAVQVQVDPNGAPTVTITSPDAGSSFTEGVAVTFQGAAADPEEGDLSAGLEWTSDLDGALGTGPSVETAALSVGTHTVTAVVQDARGQAGSATVQVEVTPDAVPAVAISQPGTDTTVVAGSPVSFAGSASDPEDGDLSASIQWRSSIDGILGTGASLQVSSLSVGTHTITAAATDGAGQEGTAAVQVTVAENAAPQVVITTPGQDGSVGEGNTVTFQGTATDPEDGDLSGSIIWTSSLDGPLGTGASVSVATLSVGTHTITASATDSGGKEGAATRTIQVTANAAPQVTIVQPAQDVTVAPGEAVTLAATASDVEDGDLSAAVAWSSDLDGSLGTGASVVVSTLSTGTHTVTASVSDSRGQVASSTRRVTVQAPGLDLWIDAVHLNQANQDYAGTVGGIAGRPGLLRIVALASETNSEAPGVRVRLYQGTSVVLDQIIPAPRTGVPTAGQVDLGDATHTWNLELPAPVVGDGLSVVAEFDESGGPVDGQSGNNRFPATGEHSLDVAPLPTLRVRFIPIENTNNGRVGNVNASNMTTLLDTVRTHLAVSSVEPSVGTVFSSGYDLSTGAGWNSLLTDLQAVRVAEGAIDEYYHGIIPYTGSEAYGGLAYVPGSPGSAYRSGISVDVDRAVREVVAHELGHNLGLFHAPGCGAGNPDPDYPTVTGVLDGVGWNPNGGRLVPAGTTYDLMSYCDPTYVSAHNFGKMVDWRRRDPLAQAAPAPTTQGGLLVWGWMGPSGVELNPGIPVDGPAWLPESGGPLTLRLVGEGGGTVRSVSFAGAEVSHAPGEVHFAFVIPMDGATVRQLRELVLTGPRGTARVPQPQQGGPGAGLAAAREAGGRVRLTWDAGANPVALVRQRSTGRVLAIARGGDALVRADGIPDSDLEVLLPDGRRIRLGPAE